jgi:tetratricopeptide (TPR) repeat protein
MLTAMRGLAIVLVLAVVSIARAEPGHEDEASTIFQRGRELVKLGRHDEACALFEQSYALEPALGTAVNLADCLERQGQLRRAWELFDRVARDSQNVQSRARLARDRADALLARLATVIVTLRDPTAPGLAVRLAGRPVAPASEIRELVEPRDLDLVVTVPGQPAFTATLHAVAGALATVEVPAFARDAPPAHSRRRRSRVYLAGGVSAAGVVGLGVSLGLALSAKRRYDGAFDSGACQRGEPSARCTREGKVTIDRAGERADLATGFAIGGVVLAGIGAALFFTAPRETIRVEPIATGRALGVGVVGRF